MDDRYPSNQYKSQQLDTSNINKKTNISSDANNCSQSRKDNIPFNHLYATFLNFVPLPTPASTCDPFTRDILTSLLKATAPHKKSCPPLSDDTSTGISMATVSEQKKEEKEKKKKKRKRRNGSSTNQVASCEKLWVAAGTRILATKIFPDFSIQTTVSEGSKTKYGAVTVEYVSRQKLKKRKPKVWVMVGTSITANEYFNEFSIKNATNFRTDTIGNNPTLCATYQGEPIEAALPAVKSCRANWHWVHRGTNIIINPLLKEIRNFVFENKDKDEEKKEGNKKKKTTAEYNNHPIELLPTLAFNKRHRKRQWVEAGSANIQQKEDVQQSATKIVPKTAGSKTVPAAELNGHKIEYVCKYTVANRTTSPHRWKTLEISNDKAVFLTFAAPAEKDFNDKKVTEITTIETYRWSGTVGCYNGKTVYLVPENLRTITLKAWVLTSTAIAVQQVDKDFSPDKAEIFFMENKNKSTIIGQYKGWHIECISSLLFSKRKSKIWIDTTSNTPVNIENLAQLALYTPMLGNRQLECTATWQGKELQLVSLATLQQKIKKKDTRSNPSLTLVSRTSSSPSAYSPQLFQPSEARTNNNASCEDINSTEAENPHPNKRRKLEK